jgi:hypothetical protein
MRSLPGWVRRHPWVCLGLLVAPTAVASLVVNVPLSEADQQVAVRRVVAWIVADQRLPGAWERYADAEHMPRMRRFFVVCDFLPADFPISNDPRVRLVSQAEYEALFKKHRWDATDYLFLEREVVENGRYTVELANGFGPLAGHGYRIAFRKKLRGLQASVKFLWVS